MCEEEATFSPLYEILRFRMSLNWQANDDDDAIFDLFDIHLFLAF